MAFARLAEVKGHAIAREKVLAIGDGIRTDIKGAAAAKVESVFIASGVHLSGEQLTSETVAPLFPDPAVRPIAAMSRLVW
jgi:ribonucleotide monophosphatase NagD (HAD superfamily)